MNMKKRSTSMQNRPMNKGIHCQRRPIYMKKRLTNKCLKNRTTDMKNIPTYKGTHCQKRTTYFKGTHCQKRPTHL